MGRHIQLFLVCGHGCVTLLCGRMAHVLSSNWSGMGNGHVRFHHGHILPLATTISHIFWNYGFLMRKRGVFYTCMSCGVSAACVGCRLFGYVHEQTPESCGQLYHGGVTCLCTCTGMFLCVGACCHVGESLSGQCVFLVALPRRCCAKACT